jgi:hypothetical protein
MFVQVFVVAELAMPTQNVSKPSPRNLCFSLLTKNDISVTHHYVVLPLSPPTMIVGVLYYVGLWRLPMSLLTMIGSCGSSRLSNCSPSAGAS